MTVIHERQREAWLESESWLCGQPLSETDANTAPCTLEPADRQRSPRQVQLCAQNPLGFTMFGHELLEDLKVGGMLTSAVLILVVFPVLYEIVHRLT